MKKKLPATLDEFLEKDPKLKKEFNEKFEKWKNRPKPNPKLKIGLKYIKENFNLDLFLNKIEEKGNYKYRNDGDMLDVVILNGFNQEEVTKIYDHLDDKEFDKLHRLAERDKLLSKITDNFEIFDNSSIKTRTDLFFTTIWFSKRNSTYYLFIDMLDFERLNKGICLYFKSKNEKIITNKMLKFIQQTDKDNQKRRLRLH
ncbi:hypothetical protein N8160_03545 [Pelagibacteraceae bacterium]|jgi:hypothetical protein|nr:hypothetical protein [Pelagibacteraceae bacterium]